jgi:hypothetical protein
MEPARLALHNLAPSWLALFCPTDVDRLPRACQSNKRQPSFFFNVFFVATAFLKRRQEHHVELASLG